jgi:hypothetical protein
MTLEMIKMPDTCKGSDTALKWPAAQSLRRLERLLGSSRNLSLNPH